MIKRILNFNDSDWKHIGFLTKNLFHNLLILDYKEAKECYYFIKIHVSHDSDKIN